MQMQEQVTKKTLVEGKWYCFVAMMSQSAQYVGCWDKRYWFKKDEDSPLSWLSTADSLEEVIELSHPK